MTGILIFAILLLTILFGGVIIFEFFAYKEEQKMKSPNKE